MVVVTSILKTNQYISTYIPKQAWEYPRGYKANKLYLQRDGKKISLLKI